jgi:hypothetical protein
MGSATARRFALVAGMVLLASLGGLPGSTLGRVERSDGDLASPATSALAPVPAIRRHGAPASWPQQSQARGLLAVAAAALLVLARLAPWGAVAAVQLAPSPLARRRHAIALRAPPLAA